MHSNISNVVDNCAKAVMDVLILKSSNCWPPVLIFKIQYMARLSLLARNFDRVSCFKISSYSKQLVFFSGWMRDKLVQTFSPVAFLFRLTSKLITIESNECFVLEFVKINLLSPNFNVL